MARYDVYSFSGGTNFVLDVQADLLDDLNTRIVVPLLELSKAPKPAKRLNPTFEFEGVSYVLATQFLAAVPRSELRQPVTNFSNYSDDITNALDMVFQGF